MLTTKSISYSETRSFGDYQNATVGVTVELGGGSSDTELAIQAAKDWVQQKLQERVNEHKGIVEIRHKNDVLFEERENLQREIIDRRAELETLKARFERAKEFLAKHGVNIEIPEEELPF